MNKNLNFVPTPKNCNKKQLDNDAENFFHLIRLQAHFKDINPKSNIDQGKLPFQIKNKQKWTPNDTHHNVSAFIDLVQNDLNKEKRKRKILNPIYPKGNKKQWKNFQKEKILL